MGVPTATQGTTGSFSSLIDYNPENASDSEEGARASTPGTELPSSTPPVTSRVELLKLRLRMAMYKINTNQMFVPFASLALPNARCASVGVGEGEDLEEEEVEEEYLSPVREMHTQKQAGSQNILITGGAIGRLLQGPTLLPTAYSSRFLEAGPYTPLPSPRELEEYAEPTSSAVKGDAATGLLELMHAK